MFVVAAPTAQFAVTGIPTGLSAATSDPAVVGSARHVASAAASPWLCLPGVMAGLPVAGAVVALRGRISRLRTVATVELAMMTLIFLMRTVFVDAPVW